MYNYQVLTSCSLKLGLLVYCKSQGKNLGLNKPRLFTFPAREVLACSQQDHQIVFMYGAFLLMVLWFIYKQLSGCDATFYRVHIL